MDELQWELELGRPTPGIPYLTIYRFRYGVARLRRDNGKVEYAWNAGEFDFKHRGLIEQFIAHRYDFLGMRRRAYVSLCLSSVGGNGGYLGDLSDVEGVDTKPIFGEWTYKFIEGDTGLHYSLNHEIGNLLVKQGVPSDATVKVAEDTSLLHTQFKIDFDRSVCRGHWHYEANTNTLSVFVTIENKFR